MFFILSKVLSFVISPSSWIVALLVYALWTKNPRRRRRAIMVNLILFLILTNSFLAQRFIGMWEYEKQNIEAIETYEVGILLGGYLTELKGDYDFTTLNNSGSRFIQTVELYHAGKIKKILLSGGNGALASDFKEAISSLNLLLKMGVKREDILIEKASRNTYENAFFSAKILNEKYPEAKFLLITSAFHQRRAIACFQKQGLDCDAFSADVKSERKIAILNTIVPDTENIDLWKLTIKEMIGYVVYKIQGYL